MIVHTTEITYAIKQLGKANGRSGYRNVNLAGRLMVSFAKKNTKVASPAKIKAYMVAPAQKRTGQRHVPNPSVARSRAKLANKWKGTRAAAIIGAKHRAKGKVVAGGVFYRRVDKFAKEAVKSAGYHRAGWIPASRAFRDPGKTKRGAGRFKRPVPGKAASAKRSQKFKPRAYLENFARGITTVQPNLLKRQVVPVTLKLIQFAQQDLRLNTRKLRLR